MPQAIVWSSVPCSAHQTPPSNKYNITSILSRLKMSCSLELFCMMCASFEFHRSQSPQVSHIHVSYCLSQHNTHNIIKSTMSPNGARANWLWFILFRGFETISICTCDKYITEQTNFIRIARFSLPLIPFLWFLSAQKCFVLRSMGMQIDFDVVRTACVHFLPACQSVAHTNTKSLWNEFVAITLVLEMAEKTAIFLAMPIVFCKRILPKYNGNQITSRKTGVESNSNSNRHSSLSQFK